MIKKRVPATVLGRWTVLAAYLVLGCAPAAQRPPVAPATQAARAARVDLLKDAHRSYARAAAPGAQQPPWQDTVLLDRYGKHPVTARITFSIEDPSAWQCVELALPQSTKVAWTLNGQAVSGPVQGMIYKTTPGIPATLLKNGENVLTAAWTAELAPPRNQPATISSTRAAAATQPSPTPVSLPVRMYALTAADLAFQTGPVLGYAGTSAFTVAARTNVPAEVTLEVDGRRFTSPAGLIHNVKADGLRPNTAYSYTLSATAGKSAEPTKSGPYTVRTLAEGDKLVFVAAGDSRSFPESWNQVSKAIAQVKPAFCTLTGDLVPAGLNDDQWDAMCFDPAKDLFSTVPCYPVLGNHEQDSPLFPLLFATPSGKSNWSQQIGPVLLIGIDGTTDWSAPDGAIRWLKDVLAGSEARFIFLVTHYPAWTSGPHGAVDAENHPKEKPGRQAQEILMPLLKQYHATAMIAGHDHMYERSEPPEGVTVIISGGGGAELRPKAKTADTQNPHSKVFVETHHYCVFTIDGQTCTMQAITPEGQILDTRQWSARTGR